MCLLFSEAAAANQVAVWVWMIRAERTKRDVSVKFLQKKAS